MSAKLDDILDLPDWPGALRIEAAAAYCSMSVDSFEECVAAGRFPGPIPDLPVRIKLWSRASLDKALAGRSRGDDDADAREAAWHRKREDRSPHSG